MDLSIIITNWNSSDLLNDCLKSIILKTSINYEIIVIDNNSDDNFNEIKQKYYTYDQIIWIEKDENLGCGVINEGFKIATGKHIAIVGPDTELTDDVFLKIITLLNSNDKLGAVAPQLINPDGSKQDYLNDFISLGSYLKERRTLFGRFNRLAYKLKTGEKFSLSIKKKPISENLFEINQPSAACLVMSENWIRKQSYLIDPAFPYYFNDMDICKRIYNEGKKIYMLSDSEVVHIQSSSFKKTKVFWRQKNYLNDLTNYFKKHHPEKLTFLKFVNCSDNFLKIFFYPIIDNERKPGFKNQINLFFHSINITRI
ncbi:glycosyltransferase [Patescibacteria group bacterium]|nr:glycosyltransferase [Patescibacteria group bacterium]